jgi:hypothetical protein
MANEFIARNGLIAQNNSTITGSLNVTAGITGSLLGTASTASYVTLAQTASYVTLAQTASYVTTAQTASYITGSIHTSTNPALSASYASSSTSASYASSSTSASYALTASSISSNYITDFLPVTFDGQGAVININTNGTIYIPYNCTITGWTLLESSNPTPLTASVTLDAWKNIYASYPPTASNTIFGTKPTLTSAIKNQATGLSIAATAGDLMIVTVVSCSLAQRLKFGFAVSKT